MVARLFDEETRRGHEAARGDFFALAPADLLSLRCAMANVISFLFGTIALVLAIIGFIPLLGWLNWLIILIAGVGAAFGAASDKNSGRNFCFVVMGICALRLWIGGGII